MNTHLTSLTYTLIDALDLPDLTGHVRNRHGTQDTSIYTDILTDDYEMEVPRLIKLDEELLEWLTPTIKTDAHWGFAMALRDEYQALSETEQLTLLVDHFRSWTSIITPFKERWLFRFYDPTVIRAYFSAATHREAAEFFGPCQTLYLIAPDLETTTLTLNKLYPKGLEFSKALFRSHPIAPLNVKLMNALHSHMHQQLFSKFCIHLREHHAVTRDWADKKLDDFVASGVQRAWHDQFKNEQDILQYLSLEVILGQDFVNKPEHTWAKTIIEKQTLSNQSRMEQLFEQAIKQLQTNS